MTEKKYLYNKGLNYRSCFVCPIELPNGFTYRCFCPEDDPEMQLGSGLFTSVADALEAGQTYLDRERQYRTELSYYKKLLETEAISAEEYHNNESSLEQAIWGLS